MIFGNTLPGGSSLLVVAAMGVAIVFLLRRSYRYFRHGKNDSSAMVHLDRPDKKKWKASHSDPEELLRYEVRIQDASRELSGRLDSKMSALMELLRQANEKIARLEHLTGGSPKQSSSSSPTSPSPASSSKKINPKYVAIFKLADEGFSATTIAHKVSKSIDEIKAILAEQE